MSKRKRYGDTFGTLDGKVYVRAVIDGTFYDLMPNFKDYDDNFKILGVVPSIVDGVWRQTFLIWDDGKTHEKYIDLK